VHVPKLNIAKKQITALKIIFKKITFVACIRGADG